VQFDTKVGTDISRVGDGVEIHLLKPVEAEGREVLPVSTILFGRVVSVRKGDTHKKVVPVLRLAFELVRLPDGRTFPVKASLANLGVSESIDSEGAATPTPNTKSGNVAAAAGTAGVGAGIGAIAGGGSGAAKGAGVGAGIGILGDLLTRNSDYWDFTLNKGRKAWLRLDEDLVLAAVSLATSKDSDTANEALQSPVAQKLPKPSPGEHPETLPRQSVPTSQPPPSSPNHLNMPTQFPELLCANFVDSIKALTLDTGPFVAAEVHRWDPSNKLQFVTVSVQYKSDCGDVCAPYTATLRTDSGSEYSPGVIARALTGTHVDQPTKAGSPLATDPHRQEGVKEDSYSYQEQVKTYFFTVRRADQPTTLNLALPSDVGTLCHAEYLRPNSHPGAPEQVSLPLEGLPMRNNLIVVNQHSGPVRFGQLAVAVTAVATTNELGNRLYRRGPTYGHYFVSVALGIKNVSSNPNCTHFTAQLLADRGYKAENATPFWDQEVQMSDLMPGESSGGTLSFEVYQDSRPVGLALRRSILAEKYCAQKLSRPVDMHGGSMVRIQITGVPGVLAGHR
jgi:hypothetical protein